jgi:hypothetical protein
MLLSTITLAGRLKTGKLDRRETTGCVCPPTDVLGFGFVDEVEMMILEVANEAFCFSGVLLCLFDDPRGLAFGRPNGDWAIVIESRFAGLGVAADDKGRGAGGMSMAVAGREVDE